MSKNQSDERVVSIAEIMEAMEMVRELGICPTRCPEGCDVEPDGVCPHGYESLLLEQGMI